MAWPLRLFVVSVVLTAALVAVGTFLHAPSTRHTDAETTTAPPAATPLAEPLSSVDTATLTVQRAPFCNRLSSDDLKAALGGAVRHTAPYSAGDKATVGRGVTDVVDEYGCRWSSSHRQARAWVFAAAVAPTWARRLAADVPAGCQTLHGISYGAPSSALRCGDAIRLRGLFGQAWLTCELTNGDVDLAGRFCLAVARAGE